MKITKLTKSAAQIGDYIAGNPNMQVRKLTQDDQYSTFYQAVLNPALRSKFSKIGPEGWADYEEMVNNGLWFDGA
jgi:hypothetical protein